MKLAFPHVLGSDAAGVVVAVGSRVRRVSVGDEVLLNPGLSCGECSHCIGGEPSLCARYRIMGEQCAGTYAEVITVPAANLLPVPAGLTLEAAASLPLTLLTTWRMMITRGRILPGEWVLIWGAGSGVGVLAIQIARAVGARVIAIASTADKRAKAEVLGAEWVLDGADAGLERRVRELSGGGVDVVVDYVGQATWNRSLRCLRKGGRLLTCGAASGHAPVEDLRQIFFRQLSVIGSTMGSRNDLEAGLQLVARGLIRPVIHEVLPLRETGRGHALLKQREVFGKIVISMDGAGA